MRIIGYNQNTKEWRQWRGKGLGASDAASVLGESPWTSPLELWLDKTGIRIQKFFNEYQIAAMRRGNELEPVVRGIFEKKMGALFPSLSAEHDDYPFIRASFDGYNAGGEAILEIKCPNKVDHAKALGGEVPAKYVAQVQQQLLISGAKVCYYVSWNGVDPDLAIVPVYPDAEFQGRLLLALVEFWRSVVELKMPAPSQDDAAKFAKEAKQKYDEAGESMRLLNIILGNESIVPKTKKGLKSVNS